MHRQRPVSRRQFLKTGAAFGIGLMLPLDAMMAQRRALLAIPHALANASPQVPLPARNIPQFVDPLPLLTLAGGPIETIIADANEITLSMREFKARMLPATTRLPKATYTGTYVWGYRHRDPGDLEESYIGPVIVATRGVPTTIKWVNSLGTTENSALLAWLNATDQTLHWADPLDSDHSHEHYAGPIPAVPHLHGGEVPPTVDGGPDAWFTSDGAYVGSAYFSADSSSPKAYATYTYPNSQEAAPAWFHDHVLGITRLNVYAGLAGAYPIVDPTLELPTGLHPVGLRQGDDGPVDYVIPLVIQDRMFDENGQLFFDNVGINPEHPFWIPEFVGDTIVVNGKSWPYLEVEPRRYRFLLINGSNARTYELFLSDQATKVAGPALYQIATDGGYLDAPVKIDPNAPKGQLQRLVLMPGERADVVVDFAGLAPGTRLLLRNVAKTPFPNGGTPKGDTIGRIMQFRVNAPRAGFVDTSYNPALGTPLRPANRRIVRLVDLATGKAVGNVDKRRQLTLNEVMGAGGPLEVLVNNTRWSGVSERPYEDFEEVDDKYYSELPTEGQTELWELVNLTADAHPIHTHLTQFQLMNRQRFDVAKYNAAYDAAFPGSAELDPMTNQTYPPGVYIPGFGPPRDYRAVNNGLSGGKEGGNPDVTAFLQGSALPPAPNETGWKDTVIAYPGQVTRLVVRYAPTDRKVDDTDQLFYPFDPAQDGHGYVWHCHIIDHEDNEMMRPLLVRPNEHVLR